MQALITFFKVIGLVYAITLGTLLALVIVVNFTLNSLA